jgi:rubrerythrin
MGVRDYITVLADGGGGVTTDSDGQRIHHECRDCGKNLDGDDDACPNCGGAVVLYRF